VSDRFLTGGKAVNPTTSTTTFEVHLPQPERPKCERERLAFLRLLPGLLATHRGEYVAIHEEKVVDSGPDAAELAARAVRRFKADIYVGLVSEEAEPVCRLGGARPVVRWEALSWKRKGDASNFQPLKLGKDGEMRWA
jgi:hypothetical protein